jgi:hypothetical protein
VLWMRRAMRKNNRTEKRPGDDAINATAGRS